MIVIESFQQFSSANVFNIKLLLNLNCGQITNFEGDLNSAIKDIVTLSFDIKLEKSDAETFSMVI